jgi:hypothetical protein
VIFGTSDHFYRLAPALSEEELLKLERRYGVRLPDDYRAYLMQIGNGGCGPGYGLQRFGDERHLASRPNAIATGELRRVANTPQCAISVSIMVDETGREVDLFDLRFYHTIDRLQADPDALGRPFPFVQSGFRWDEDSDESAVVYEGVFEGGAGDGILQLAHYGCGIFAFLVVAGEALGTVWVNDRANGTGLGHIADYLPADYSPEDMLHGGLWRKPGPHSFADWYEDWLDTSLELALRV